MSSTFLGLNTAYTGLMAANAALNTTANNISNSETKGYSRQEVNQQATEALRMFTTYGCVGAGVDVISIERIRDGFYDKKYWENEARLGQQTTKEYYYAQLEIFFSDDTNVQGFNTVFNKMYDALDEVRKNAEDSTTKEQFITYSTGFTQYFNNLYNQLQTMQKDCNDEIKIMVDKISSISQQLSVLNQRINSLEVVSENQKANELRDQRERLIDDLSSIVSTEVLEVPILDQYGNETNATRYTVKICGGQTLVDNEMYRTLSCVAREDYENINQSDVIGLYDIYWDYDEKNYNSDKFNLSNGAIGGKLQGLIEMRDGNNGEYFHGNIKDVHKTMFFTGEYEDKKDAGGNVIGSDPIYEQRTAIKIEVTSDYLKDLNKTNLADKGVIKVANKEYHYDGFTFTQEQDSMGEVHYYYEIVLGREDTLDRSAINKQATVGGSVNYQGIPYYQQQMTEWIRTYAEAFNNILTDHSVDSYGHEGINMFVADAKIDDEQYNFSEYRQKEETFTYLNLISYTSEKVLDYEKKYRANQNDPAVPNWFKTMMQEYDQNGKVTLPANSGQTDYDDILASFNYLDAKCDISTGTKAIIETYIKNPTDSSIPNWYQSMMKEFENTGNIILSVTNLDNSYYKLNGGSFDVSNEMKHDAQLLATHTKDYDTSSTSSYDTIEKLQQLKTDKSMMSFRGGSASEFLQNILADVALNSNSAITFSEKYTSLASMITNQRLSISGVDNDEEAANLVKYQTAYNLSSKMIQVLTEVYDRLILQTGV